jgi:predicted dithiol-disulfide oxidoreductase (DUF899 family)
MFDQFKADCAHLLHACCDAISKASIDALQLQQQHAGWLLSWLNSGKHVHDQPWRTGAA